MEKPTRIFNPEGQVIDPETAQLMAQTEDNERAKKTSQIFNYLSKKKAQEAANETEEYILEIKGRKIEKSELPQIIADPLSAYENKHNDRNREGKFSITNIFADGDSINGTYMVKGTLFFDNAEDGREITKMFYIKDGKIINQRGYSTKHVYMSPKMTYRTF